MFKYKSLKLFFYKLLIILAVVLLTTEAIYSQKVSTADIKKLHQKEDSLKVLARDFIMDSLTAGRMRSDSQFVKTLIRSLQIKNSFYYPFDSVQGVAKVYAPDSTFRILSWNLSFDQYYSRQRAAIQFKTPDGSLKLVPLRDVSEFTENAIDSVRNKNNWIGAVYYNIVKTEYNGKNFYTLIGFDNNNVMSNKKWLEVMTFNQQKEPVFGGPFFSFAQDSAKRPTQNRFYIEYKKEARAVLDYDPDLNLIIVDHLVSETDEPENKFSYVPDGDVEAFEWKNGKWLHIDKLYDFKLKDGEFPMPEPLRDDKGNVLPKKKDEER
jgi:hypothetical protein